MIDSIPFHNVFSYDNFTKTSEISLKSSEIMVRGWKSQLSVEEMGCLLNTGSDLSSAWVTDVLYEIITTT